MTLESLPLEILTYILLQLDVPDILRIGQVNTLFRTLRCSHDLWVNKAYQEYCFPKAAFRRRCEWSQNPVNEYCNIKSNLNHPFKYLMVMDIGKQGDREFFQSEMCTSLRLSLIHI